MNEINQRYYVQWKECKSLMNSYGWVKTVIVNAAFSFLNQVANLGCHRLLYHSLSALLLSCAPGKPVFYLGMIFFLWMVPYFFVVSFVLLDLRKCSSCIWRWFGNMSSSTSFGRRRHLTKRTKVFDHCAGEPLLTKLLKKWWCLMAGKQSFLLCSSDKNVIVPNQW